MLAKGEKAGVLAAAVVDLPRRRLPFCRQPVAVDGKLRARRATNQLVGRAADPIEPREHGFHVQRLAMVRRTAQREVALTQIEVIRGAGLHQTQRLNELERRAGEGGVGRVADAQDDRAGGRVNDSAVTGVDGLEAFVAQPVGQRLGRSIPMGRSIGGHLGALLT